MIGFRKRFQCEFAGTVEAKRWEDQTSRATAYVQEQAASPPSHIGKYSAVNANRAEEIRVHNLPGLFGCDGFCQTDQGVSGVVYGNVNSSRLLHTGVCGLLHGTFFGDIKLQDR